MLKDKNELVAYLTKVSDKIMTNKQTQRNICDYANEKYKIPKGLVSDFLTERVSPEEFSVFELFIIFESFHAVISNDIKLHQISKYYTEKEINFYKEEKYKNEVLKFPIKFKMVQIAEDQWIGKIDVQTLMKFRKAQIINYNADTQRTMKRIVNGDGEEYKISLNKESVAEIADLMIKGLYIPDPFTLNISASNEKNAFYFNEKNSEFIITELAEFDIIDGYHRYVASCNVVDMNPNFNYTMELRLVSFMEDKAKQFIFQQDQKTTMSKIDSSSMNMNKASNIAAERLNNNSQCNFRGLISRNDGIIPLQLFAEASGRIFFKGIKRDKENFAIINYVKKMTEYLNILSEYNMDYLENRWDYATVYSFITCCRYFELNSMDINNMPATVEKATLLLKEKYPTRVSRQKFSADMDNIVLEVVKAVI